MQPVRRRLTLAATTIAVLAAGLATAAPAAAATPRTLTAGGPVTVCMVLNPNLCLTSNGAGAQMTIETSGVAQISSTTDGNYAELHNGSGKCLREDSDSEIVTESISCTASDQHEQWTINGPLDSTTFKNRATGDVIGVTGPQAGNNVWGGGTGNDWHWVT